MKANGDNIRKAMDRIGMQQVELAKTLKITPAAVSLWMRNGSIAAKYAQRLPEILGGEFDDYVTDRDDYPFLGVAKLVPVIRWSAVGRAKVGVLTEDDIIQRIPQYVMGAAFALLVESDSMEPEFTRGDIILIDPDAEIKSGHMVVASIPDSIAPMLRRFMIEGSEKLLVATNSRYPVMPMPEGTTMYRVIYKAKPY